MRRIMMILVLAVAGYVWPITSAVAGGSTATAAPAAGTLQADFNNDGADDLAVGVPDEDVGGAVDAGAVNVLYGSGAGLTGSGSQQFTQVGSAPETDDLFGQALASGDFNNDGFADLAAGAPFEDVGGAAADAGATSALYGTAGTGLSVTGAQTFTQVGGSVEAGDGFGYGLAAGNFDGDGDADLGVSAPFETVGGDFLAGAVSAVPGSGGGLVPSAGQLFTQDTAGVPSAAETEDFFGLALAVGDSGPGTMAAASPSAASASSAPLSRVRRAAAGR